MPDSIELDRAQILAFRAVGHGLGVRRRHEELVRAVAAIGLRRTKEMALALAARVEGATADDLHGALRDGLLVAVYGARGTVMVVPAEDVAIFTVGAAPTGEESLRAAIPGAFLRRLDAAGMTATDALQAVTDAVREALAKGPLPRGETAMAVTRLLPPTLTPPCRGRCPDPHVEDSLFRLAGVNGAMRFDRDGDVLVAMEVDRTHARPELVRRYLHCYGPSTFRMLAEWAGIAPADARHSLAELGDEVVDVNVGGAKAGLMLRSDVDQAARVEVRGVRFLPAFDPYLLDRDRSTLVPDRAEQKVVWRASGNPGVVLVDGEPVATWRTNRESEGTAFMIHPLGPPLPALDDLSDEASRAGDVLGRNGPFRVTLG